MSDQSRVLNADAHFTAGNLRYAESLCKELWEEKTHSPLLNALLGEVLLLRNRPDEAEPILRKAVTEQGGNLRLRGLLAECLRRSDRLLEAAELYKKLGRSSFSDKLGRLADSGWYLLTDSATVNLPWASHADMPLVEISVNGVEGHFLLDTGMIGAAVDLPFSTAEAADVEVARDIEGTGFGVSNAMRS